MTDAGRGGPWTRSTRADSFRGRTTCLPTRRSATPRPAWRRRDPSIVRDVQDQARRGELAPKRWNRRLTAVVIPPGHHPCGRYSMPPASSSIPTSGAPRSRTPPRKRCSRQRLRRRRTRPPGRQPLRRGAGARAALLAACPAAEAALVVNNGAAALVLATTALAAGKEVVLSRGELVEIGAGFRLTDLMESTGACCVRSAPPTGHIWPTTRTPWDADGMPAQGPPQQFPGQRVHLGRRIGPGTEPADRVQRRAPGGRPRQRTARTRPAAAG